MTQIAVVDLGGTHARFALAEVGEGRVLALGEPVIFKAAEQPRFEEAWRAFLDRLGRPAPACAVIAIAADARADPVRLTNHDWVIHPAALPAALGVEKCRLLNDFEAVAHAVAQLEPAWFEPIAGPDRPLLRDGVITIVGPGTGLGVAQLVRAGGRYHALATEGGHIGFAPIDKFEDDLLGRLRERYGRVSVERVVSGPGLAALYESLGGALGSEDKSLWAAALAGTDRRAAAALDRFCGLLGAVAGDLALAQGADAVVIAGGVGQRLADRLPRSRFHARFVEKGRFRSMMEGMPVKLVTHPQAGLYGAAAAFAAEASAHPI